jgi:hypothetical protein
MQNWYKTISWVLRQSETRAFKMLPPSVETPRGRYLQDILQNTPESEWADWPILTRDDYVLVGGIVVLFSYMDLNLRRVAEVTDKAGLLQRPSSGKTEQLNITDVEAALQTLDRSEQNKGALSRCFVACAICSPISSSDGFQPRMPSFA